MGREAESFFSGLDFLKAGLEIETDGPGRIAAAFLAALAGGTHDGLPGFLSEAVGLVHKEFDEASGGDRAEEFDRLKKLLSGNGDVPDKERAEAFWRAFFPEAMYLDDDPDRQIGLLRARRTITVDSLCGDAITDPAGEMIFTSNVLLAPPAAGLETPPEGPLRDVVVGAEKARAEKQDYWYDHPVPIGIPVVNDEAVYGLRGLAETMRYEKRRGSIPPDARMKVLLSVSVTHRGLREWALPWLKAQIDASGEDFSEELEVYAFTEEDSGAVAEILADWLPGDADAGTLQRTFGVDGEYGRHYSFLKALPAFMSIMNGGREKATFKIDLDQVFPEDVLAAETGKSALEHFSTGLWGASARDDRGRKLDLGMIAGGLVNEKDIGAGLFTPDIPWPADMPAGEDLVFFKQRPMAVSTRAELMTRYGYPGSPDGKKQALQRIHVTGGTNGIRFDALRRHRPFTPSFVGRAEDQAFILSVLEPEKGPRLAYIHESGLFMRHDKEAFATDAVKAGKAGSYVGDLVRLFVFSGYARMLPSGRKGVKDIVDPFTGCFITRMPATMAFLRLALRLIAAEGGSEDERTELLSLAEQRLSSWTSDPDGMAEKMKAMFNEEKTTWNAYYDALDDLEKDLAAEEEQALKARRAFRKLLDHCRVAG